jgi:hypothetical protein
VSDFSRAPQPLSLLTISLPVGFDFAWSVASYDPFIRCSAGLIEKTEPLHDKQDASSPEASYPPAVDAPSTTGNLYQTPMRYTELSDGMMSELSPIAAVHEHADSDTFKHDSLRTIIRS